MFVCVCVCMHLHAGVCMCVCVVLVGADGCIPLTMLADVCQCCLLKHVCMLTAFQDTFLVIKLGE